MVQTTGFNNVLISASYYSVADLFPMIYQESQTDSQDEMAYLKRQVKSLTNQIQQQQQKITELRYRTSSPGPVTMGAVRASSCVKRYWYCCVIF